MANNKPSFKQKSKKRDIEYVKDSPGRSIAKAFSWRLIATGTTFLVSLFVLDKTTENGLDQNMQFAGAIASIEFFAKLLIYYLHERLWTNILWGKSWRSSYLGRRMWRRLYRKMHKENTQLS